MTGKTLKTHCRQLGYVGAQHMVVKNRVGFVGVLITVASLHCSANAEDGIRLPLEKFKRAEEVAVQRGESVANGACVFNLVEELRAYAGEPTGWFITFDSSTGVKFDSPANPEFRHICVDGKQTTFDHGAETIGQIYDNDGNPTIAEP
ncbi:hypothetical protein IHQ71_28405 [Rhizobium sp. TH2]|uniref:hypothetical protein n=1 Tax=Rhizobium sp. TH2 TaxID=2775403 RepID=UPI002157DE9F|nr:hypothetical protein [Rhizobium sp. TH2]UVC08987.1 hypothetical protein IHQ71_28405 [Rhizobium sp. TH2]